MLTVHQAQYRQEKADLRISWTAWCLVKAPVMEIKNELPHIYLNRVPAVVLS